jgi:glycosyltransferase involved in cell wall biosynthesis
MRILMTADTVGGVWSYAVALARHFASRKVQTVLATMGRPLTDTQWLQVGENPLITVCESEYRLEWMQAPWDDVNAAGAWLLELERRYRPDVIHLNNYAHGHLRWRAPVLLVGHSCVFSWWRAVRGGRPPEVYDRYHQSVRDGLDAADAVVAPSRFMLEQLRQYHPLPDGEVIYNGADPFLFRPGAKEPLVLTVGRLWDEAKNVQAAVKAAGDFDWPLLLAGDTRHPEGWNVEIGEVRHLGSLPPEALARWYGASSIYLFPARYEPFGLSVLEAALAGCALVLGDIPSLRELWQDAAIFVPPDQPKAIATAVNGIIEDFDLRMTLGQRARALALPRTVERCADAYLRRYTELSRNASAKRTH